jgi:heptosyltransferase-1
MRRILFVKTSSLGDVVHNCPAVSDAARNVPGAVIDWVVEESFAGIAQMHRAVRRVVPVALRRWRRSLWSGATWSEIARFRRELGEERYDAVIDTQSLLKSALIASAATGLKHGLDRASAREALASRFYDVTHAVPKAMHAVERNRALAAKALGYSLQGPADYGLRAPAGVQEGSDYAVFLAMTSRADKLWPEERWIALGRSLPLRIVLPWGSADEQKRAQDIANAIGRATVPSKMSLPELGDLFREARYVVGTDTGLTHLAAALGVRTVGLYGGSDPALTGLYGTPKALNLGERGRPPEVAEVLKALA